MLNGVLKLSKSCSTNCGDSGATPSKTQEDLTSNITPSMGNMCMILLISPSSPIAILKLMKIVRIGGENLIEVVTLLSMKEKC